MQVETVLDLEESELQVCAVKSLEEKAEAEMVREPSDPFIQVEPKDADLTELAEQLPNSKAKKLGRAKLTTMEEINAFTTKRKIEEGLSEFPPKVDGIVQLLLLGDGKVARESIDFQDIVDNEITPFEDALAGELNHAWPQAVLNLGDKVCLESRLVVM